MTTGLGLSAYIDVPRYLRVPSGVQTAVLVALNTTTGGGSQAAGTTSLVVAASAGWSAGPAWILDGPISEVVTITGSADGTHVTLAAPGTTFAHAAGASISQAGTGGCLAETILDASSWMEGYCQQGASGSDRSLFAVSRTERWAMPTMRAHIDRDSTLVVMPGHFPVQSLSALTVELGQGQTISLDTTQLELQSTGRLIEVPYLLIGGVSVGQQLMLEIKGLSRSVRQWAVVTYVGGINAGQVPYDVQRACVWIVNDMLSLIANPSLAADVQLGKRHLIQRQRGDSVGDTDLRQAARDALEPYRAEGWA